MASPSSKLSFQCREEDEAGSRRPSTSEVDSSSDMSAEEERDGDQVEEEDEGQPGAEEEEREEPRFPPLPARNAIDVEPTTSWTDLDFSVIVVLLSPVGSWLFGHDHLKNLFVVLLLIFYLHQLIEGKLYSI